MKKSTKILLYGSLISILYIILCIFIENRDIINKLEDTDIEELKNASVIESVEDRNLDKNCSIENSMKRQKKKSILDFKIENGTVTIDGQMPILADDDNLKKSIMKFCLENYCRRTITFSENREIPSWKRLAEETIEMFYDENLSYVSFSVNSNGEITINGEVSNRGSKERIDEVLSHYKQERITNNLLLKDNLLPTGKEITLTEKYIDKNSTISTLNSKDNEQDSIDIAQNKISELLKSERINFYRSRAKITPQGIKTLNKILTILKDIPDIKIEIRGYTDASGGRRVNKWISKERAKSVKRYLETHGINSVNIEAKGFGEDDLLYKDKPYSPLNRRVEIEIKRR
jgi:outer membrane protein OmpA-like peptidoglycan-associated protein